MSWRPVNWDETKWATIPYNHPPISGEQVGNVFEAGADAMLQALLPVVTQTIKAHTSQTSYDAIVNSPFWQSLYQ